MWKTCNSNSNTSHNSNCSCEHSFSSNASEKNLLVPSPPTLQFTQHLSSSLEELGYTVVKYGESPVRISQGVTDRRPTQKSGEMFFVLSVESGKLLTLPIDYHGMLIKDLKDGIKEHYGVPVSDQYLFTKEHWMLEDNLSLHQLQHGTKEKKILLFTTCRNTLNHFHHYVPTFRTTEIDINMSLMEVRKHLQPNNKQLGPKINILSNVMQNSMDEVRAVRTDQVDQLNAVKGLHAHFAEKYEDFNNVSDHVLQRFKRYLQNEQIKQELVENFPDACERLKAIPVCPSIRKALKDFKAAKRQRTTSENTTSVTVCQVTSTPTRDRSVRSAQVDVTASLNVERERCDSEGDNTLAQTSIRDSMLDIKEEESEEELEEINFYDWISASTLVSFDVTAKACKESLSKLSSEIYTKQREKVEKLDEEFRNCKLMFNKLSALFLECTTQDALADGHFQTLKTILDSATPPKEFTSLVGHNIELTVSSIANYKTTITSLRDKINPLLQDFSLKALPLVEELCSKTGELRMFEDHIEITEKNFAILMRVSNSAEQFFSSLAELERRTDFSSKFKKWSVPLAHQAKDIYDYEVSRRLEYKNKMGGHFMSNMFPFLNSTPPLQWGKLPRDFDRNIPEVTKEYLDRVASSLPDQAYILQQNIECHAVPQIILESREPLSVMPSKSSSRLSLDIKPRIHKESETEALGFEKITYDAAAKQEGHGEDTRPNSASLGYEATDYVNSMKHHLKHLLNRLEADEVISRDFIEKAKSSVTDYENTDVIKRQLALAQKEEEVIDSAMDDLERQNETYMEQDNDEKHRDEMARLEANWNEKMEEIKRVHQEEMASTLRAKEEMASTLSGEEEEMAATLSSKEEELAATLRAKEEEMRATLSGKEEELAATLRAKEEELAATLRAKEEELAATLSGKEEELAATLSGKEEELAATLSGKEEELAATLSGKEEELAATLSGKEEELAATLRAKEEELAATLRAKEEELAATLRAKEEEMTATLRAKEEEMTATLRAKEEEMTATLRAKEEIAITLSRMEEELADILSGKEREILALTQSEKKKIEEFELEKEKNLVVLETKEKLVAELTEDLEEAKKNLKDQEETLTLQINILNKKCETMEEELQIQSRESIEALELERDELKNKFSLSESHCEDLKVQVQSMESAADEKQTAFDEERQAWNIRREKFNTDLDEEMAQKEALEQKYTKMIELQKKEYDEKLNDNEEKLRQEVMSRDEMVTKMNVQFEKEISDLKLENFRALENMRSRFKTISQTIEKTDRIGSPSKHSSLLLQKSAEDLERQRNADLNEACLLTKEKAEADCSTIIKKSLNLAPDVPLEFSDVEKAIADALQKISSDLTDQHKVDLKSALEQQEAKLLAELKKLKKDSETLLEREKLVVHELQVEVDNLKKKDKLAQPSSNDVAREVLSVIMSKFNMRHPEGVASVTTSAEIQAEIHSLYDELLADKNNAIRIIHEENKKAVDLLTKMHCDTFDELESKMASLIAAQLENEAKEVISAQTSAVLETAETSSSETQTAVLETAEKSSLETQTAVLETAEKSSSETQTAVLEIAETSSSETQTAVLETAEKSSSETQTAVLETAETSSSETQTAVLETAEKSSLETQTAVLETAEKSSSETQTAVLETAETSLSESQTLVLETSETSLSESQTLVLETSETSSSESKTLVLETAKTSTSKMPADITSVRDISSEAFAVCAKSAENISSEIKEAVDFELAEESKDIEEGGAMPVEGAAACGTSQAIALNNSTDSVDMEEIEELVKNGEKVYNSEFFAHKIQVGHIKTGDEVLVLWDELHDHYRIITLQPDFYFLVPCCMNKVGLPGVRVLYPIPVKIVQMHCIKVKKKVNRFNLNIGDCLYAVHAEVSETVNKLALSRPNRRTADELPADYLFEFLTCSRTPFSQPMAFGLGAEHMKKASHKKEQMAMLQKFSKRILHERMHLVPQCNVELFPKDKVKNTYIPKNKVCSANNFFAQVKKKSSKVKSIPEEPAVASSSSMPIASAPSSSPLKTKQADDTECVVVNLEDASSAEEADETLCEKKEEVDESAVEKTSENDSNSTVGDEHFEDALNDDSFGMPQKQTD